jgi:hypothetical protein
MHDGMMHWYIVILIHCKGKIKMKSSLLLTIFTTRWKRLLLMISLFLFICTYFGLGARCPLTSKRYKRTHWVCTYHQNLTIRLCLGKLLRSCQNTSRFWWNLKLCFYYRTTTTINSVFIGKEASNSTSKTRPSQNISIKKRF